MTTDGVGEWATLAVGHGERVPNGATAITLLREIRFPHSLGMLYSTFTAYLGFAMNEDEYKVMGFAGYGRPMMVDKVRQLIRHTPDGAFTLDLDYFEFPSTATCSAWATSQSRVAPVDARPVRVLEPPVRPRYS